MTAILILIAIAVVVCALAIMYWALLSSTYGERERADEIHTITTPDLWKIRLYRHRPARGKGEPVFLCHGLFANQFNFTLPDGMSLVDALTEKGYDCWLIDLRGGRASTPPFGRSWHEVTMNDYLAGDLPAAVDYVCKVTGYPKLHWIGHSMGGMLLYAYELAYGRDRIASGTTLGSPPGFRGAKLRSPRLALNLLTLFPGAAGYVVRGLTPLARHWRFLMKYVPTNWANMNPGVGTQSLYNMLERPVPRVTETICNALDNGVLVLKKADGGEVDLFAGLDKLGTPLFAIFGAQDPFIALETAQDFFDALPGPDKKMVVLSKENGFVADYSHVDLVFGREAKDEVFNPIATWLGAHSIRAKAVAADKGVAEAPAAKKKTVAKKKPAAKRKAVAKKKPAAKKKATPKKPAAKKKAAAAG